MKIAAGIAACLAFFTFAPSIAAAQPARGPVEIVVWNIRKSVGHVRVALCDKTSFVNAKKDCPYRGEAPAKVGATVVVIPDVPAGAYAAQAFHDVNDDHVVRQGPFGVPLVGIGFSNDAPIKSSAPKYADATFDYDPDRPAPVRIKLRYFPNL